MIFLIITVVVCVIVGLAIWPAIKCGPSLDAPKTTLPKEGPEPAKQENTADVGPFRKPGKVAPIKSTPTKSPPKAKPKVGVERLEANNAWQYTDSRGVQWRSKYGIIWHNKRGRRAGLTKEIAMENAVKAVEAKKELW